MFPEGIWFGFWFPVVIVGMVFVLVIVLRLISHKERMAMIEKGMIPNEIDPVAQKSGKNSLSGGLITAFIGLALTVGLLTIGTGPWLLGGLIPLFIGFGQLIAYFVSQAGKDGNEAGTPKE